MAVQLPYKSERSASRPSTTRNYPNGLIPAKHLARCGIRCFVMVEPAACAMAAMVAAAAADGITLSATGTWRSYDQQVALFLRRYTTKCHPGRRHERWKGQDYWLRPGVAGAAVPGTSNHGRGLAADLSEGARGMTPLSTRTLRWLAANGPRFGYWNTVRSEPWHWCYCLGDDVTDAVRSAGTGSGARPAPPVDWKEIARIDKTLRAVIYPGVLQRGDSGQAVMAVQWVLVASGHDVVTDGDFGPNTERAVCAFQRSNGLGADGVVGPRTWGCLGLKGGTGDPVPNEPAEKPDKQPDVPAVKPAPRPPARPSTDGVVYVVQPKDGFVRVAKRTLFSASLPDAEAIARENGLDLDSPIHPGQRLQVADCRATKVKRGDGWNAVARRLECDVATVRRANGWQGDTLHPGMTIYGGRRGPDGAGDADRVAPKPTTTLRKGDRGAAVKKWQLVLVLEGFDPGGIDGRFGLGTVRATREFQRAHCLRPDAVVGDDTWAAADDVTAPPQTLRRGSRGDDVERWQRYLICTGADIGTADGVFGPATERATKAFQTANGLKPDGLVGSKTWSTAMNRPVTAAPAPPAPEPSPGSCLLKDRIDASKLTLAPADVAAGRDAGVVRVWNRYGGVLTALSKELGIDPNAATAVLAIESSGTAMTKSGPVIRFENHVFFDRWGKSHSSTFNAHFTFDRSKRWRGHKWRKGTTGPWQTCHADRQRGEWAVYRYAASLDQDAAITSMSIGLAQIMGFHHGRIGYDTPCEMLDAFAAGEQAQILGFFDFVTTSRGNRLLTAIRDKDWYTFARGYNGKGKYRTYGDKMRVAYEGICAARR